MPHDPGSLGMVFEENVAVPMRDGVVLRANVSRPAGPGRFPALLERTPYGKGTAIAERFVRAGYAVVSQDMRGRYASDGEFRLFTVEETHDAEDGYDTVEWVAAQPWCNGKVGTMGVSYLAWAQWQLAKLRPPHLLAMSAASIPTEISGVDWSGGFRPGRRVRWWMTNIAPDIRRRRGLGPPHTTAEATKIWDEMEEGRWLHFLPWLDLPRFLPPGLAEYAEDWLRHPTRPVWKFRQAHHEIEVPNLDFSGWYDHCNDTIRHLTGMQANARSALAREQTKLILGPWNHVGLGARKLGEIDFGPQAELGRADAVIRWFDHWLKGFDNGVDRDPPVRYFVMGSCEWKSAGAWPPPGTAEKRFYLSSDGGAGRPDGSGRLVTAPPDDQPADRYVYDPRDPVPTLWPKTLFTAPSDRRALHFRGDILHYRTEPLVEPVEIVGEPRVILHASSSAPDTDFFARLVDEHPDGPALDICYGMVRARHRRSLDREDFLTPGEVTEFTIQLGPTACRFLPGHRIHLEITSSDFPNHDRNHNTGRNDLTDTELVPARQEVHHDGRYPSRLIVNVHPIS